MSLYGAEPQVWRACQGVNFEIDPAKLPPQFASDIQNLDLDDECVIRKRRGRTAYNSAPTAALIRGAGVVYPPDGSTRKVFFQAGTAIYEDDGAGAFSSVISGLTAGRPMDFIQMRDTVYAGNGVDSVRKRTAAGSWGSISLLTAPTGAPTLAAASTVLEAFDSGTWTLSSGSSITPSFVTDPGQREGTGALKLSMAGSGAKGIYVYKAWSAGATVDLSNVDSVVLWYYADRIGVTFQVAIADNNSLAGSGLDWTKFPAWTSTQKETWVQIVIPLAAIPAANRTASTGLAIKFLDKPKKGGYPVELYFDAAFAVGPLLPDNYRYAYTRAVTALAGAVYYVTQESNPSAEALFTIAPAPPGTPTLGIDVTVTQSGSADTIRIFRYRDQGAFRRKRLVGTVPNTARTLGAAISSTSATTMTVSSGQGYSPGVLVLIDTEKLLVTAVSGTTLTVTRGVDGTTAATHSNGATVTLVSFRDTISDGKIALDDTEELVEGRIVPPLAYTYAAVNGRLVAGNVTSGGTRYPYRLYLSRLGTPEEFADSDQTARAATDPTVAGYIDIPTRDEIVRIIEHDGLLIICCDRSIWTLQGSGWDDFALRKRADVGLDARGAVASTDRLIYFLARDGVRILAPNRSFDGLFECWLISEPVASKVHNIAAAYRTNAAMGVDEVGRIHLSYTIVGATANSVALVFDPRRAGALNPQYDPLRPGWTYYATWGYSLFFALKRGGGDAGQLMAATSGGTAILYHLQRDASDADLPTQDGAAIAWFWQSQVLDAGPGAKLAASYLDSQWDAASGVSVTATPLLDGAAGGDVKTLLLGAASSGVVTPTPARFAAGTRAQRLQIKLSGSHTVAMRARALALGAFRRQ